MGNFDAGRVDEPDGALMTVRVCTAREFNVLRARLPRATRQTIPRAFSGSIGVAVQAVTPSDTPLVTRCALALPLDDVHETIARLEAEVRGVGRQ